jgi:hypothetical protein
MNGFVIIFGVYTTKGKVGDRLGWWKNKIKIKLINK